MKPYLDPRYILGLLLMMLASGGVAFADNAARMAEMQKSLNAEVLAQPFRVAESAPPSVAAEPTPTQEPATRCSKRCGWSAVYPRLSLGWHYGHRFHGFGWHYGHHSHRYGWHKDYHYHRYRRH